MLFQGVADPVADVAVDMAGRSTMLHAWPLITYSALHHHSGRCRRDCQRADRHGGPDRHARGPSGGRSEDRGAAAAGGGWGFRRDCGARI